MITPNSFLDSLRVPDGVSSFEKIDPRDPSAFKLDWNEGTLPPPKPVMESIARFLRNRNSVNWYGNHKNTPLRKAIARYCGVGMRQILVTNGSDQAAELICNAYVREGDEVVVPVPTFATFLIWPVMRGAKIREVPYGLAQEKHDIDGIIRASARAKLVYLINPFFLTLTKADIAKIAKALPNAVVLVDEAYFEFHRESAIGLVKRYKNIIVTRTFSKAFRMAGLRVGYIVADASVIDAVEKIRALSSVNIVGQVAATAALAHREYVDAYVREAEKSMAYVTKMLPPLGFEVRPTRAGFILLRHRDIPSEALQRLLEKKKIFVRRKVQSLPDWVRVNLGTLRQTRAWVAVLRAPKPQGCGFSRIL